MLRRLFALARRGPYHFTPAISRRIVPLDPSEQAALDLLRAAREAHLAAAARKAAQ